MSDEPKCWWRYNNNGGRYKTCNYSQVGSKKQKKPKVPKKAMSPEAFVSMVGADYSKMSKAEKNEYHRLDMAERRAEERILVRKNTKELIKIKKREATAERKRKQRETDERYKRKKEFSGDRLNEYLKMLKALDSAGNKLPKKEQIKERVGSVKYQKLMKKYKDADFK